MPAKTKPLVIAIDGPAGAGKSTVAQMLAARLGLAYVDSGATYRAAALKVLQSGASIDDQNEIGRIVASAEIRFLAGEGQPQVILDGKDVTAEIRGAEVTLAAARAFRACRRFGKKLIALQRSLVRGPGGGDGRPRHRHGGFPRRAAENLPQSRPERKGAAAPGAEPSAGPAPHTCRTRFRRFQIAISWMRKGKSRRSSPPRTRT